jgi:hypothetical protein
MVMGNFWVTSGNYGDFWETSGIEPQLYAQRKEANTHTPHDLALAGNLYCYVKGM